jgi:hypothetical protein
MVESELPACVGLFGKGIWLVCSGGATICPNDGRNGHFAACFLTDLPGTL